ncbi:uncharacterized protein Z520_04030 [Fonsecaea multimorphosa CBS 102226]|uniref:Uncharacterized protein n=1 Tax=Fonsecaea multimorphosa CBS 102226 TaxID=1442371 RepID=A0A0D2KB25_9EURO|nr:uncharacterized protein Z520_04030 [Fonsecaea multimorphosa CBS 102226]KIY00345.1 hypothetical protein Z520_04030 [Fonsecaea multimorphosa CBS 102226]OAL27177.1 hypothetical protein AYO22_03808 [Fonsecaea multimorphosa]
MSRRLFDFVKETERSHYGSKSYYFVNQEQVILDLELAPDEWEDGDVNTVLHGHEDEAGKENTPDINNEDKALEDEWTQPCFPIMVARAEEKGRGVLGYTYGKAEHRRT